MTTLITSPDSAHSPAIELAASDQSGPAIAVLTAQSVSRFLVLLCGFVILLGVVREIVIHQIGADTALKDLRHFALDAERSLPSWYENLSFAAAAVLLFVIARLARQNDPANRIHWALLCGIFFLMSIDAAVSFHEISVKPLRNTFGFSGLFHYSWVVIAMPMVAAIGLYFIPFLLRIPRPTAIGMVIAGIIFVGGALGTELICGYLASTSGLDTIQYKAVAALQEAMEQIGLTIFMVTLLYHLADSRAGLVIGRTPS